MSFRRHHKHLPRSIPAGSGYIGCSPLRSCAFHVFYVVVLNLEARAEFFPTSIPGLTQPSCPIVWHGKEKRFDLRIFMRQRNKLPDFSRGHAQRLIVHASTLVAVPRNLDISRDGFALVRTRHTSRSYNQQRSRKLGGKSAECIPSTLFVLESNFRDLIVGGTLQRAESIRVPPTIRSLTG